MFYRCYKIKQLALSTLVLIESPAHEEHNGPNPVSVYHFTLKLSAYN